MVLWRERGFGQKRIRKNEKKTRNNETLEKKLYNPVSKCYVYVCFLRLHAFQTILEFIHLVPFTTDPESFEDDKLSQAIFETYCTKHTQHIDIMIYTEPLPCVVIAQNNHATLLTTNYLEAKQMSFPRVLDIISL